MNITKKEEKIINQIQSKLSSCADCESWDGGKPIWLWGDPTDIYDLLQDSEIEINRREALSSEFKCPNCGCELELASKVSVKYKHQLDVEKYIDENLKKYKDVIFEFDSFIREFPLLALKNPMGKKIFLEFSNNNLPTISVERKTIFFRGRLAESSKILTSEELKNAPVGEASEGRFNHNGQSYLYLCDQKEGAASEVATDGLVWIQQFEIVDEISNILDLRFDPNEISTSTNALLLSLHLSDALVKNKMNKGNWKPDYFVTRFIMDCAKQNGYNGIRYDSIKHSLATNYVLFYPENISLTPIDNPEIIKQQLTIQRIRDFDLIRDI
ncbi:RES domain-containing protein [Flavobacterium chryseum]|uniref:RES family NAD+ phosphorylase n=1 Tax=Flavobacterium sp. P3160 TaxID=2512113 RepID=UPI00106026F2|nr:RES family NAD+ phosphorylase [Flavobacterium sp. P3160]TDO84109.1 RES domain-containing protein [Flavobacterium sp. P3160]